MPDSHGNFKGMSVPAAAWERIFGKPRCADCARVAPYHSVHCETFLGEPQPEQLNRDNRPADR